MNLSLSNSFQDMPLTMSYHQTILGECMHKLVKAYGRILTHRVLHSFCTYIPTFHLMADIYDIPDSRLLATHHQKYFTRRWTEAHHFGREQI